VWDALERHWQPGRRTRADADPLAGALHLAQQHVRLAIDHPITLLNRGGRIAFQASNAEPSL
jgi:hypothetical protein